MWNLILKHKIRSAIYFHISSYILFFLTLLMNKAILLIIFLPAAFICLFSGVWLWLVGLLEEAKRKN